MGEGAEEGLVRAQIHAGQVGVGGRRQRGQLAQRDDTVGTRRVRQAKQRLGLTHGRDAGPGDLLGGPGEVLDRAQLATGDREDVDGPEEGGGQEAVGGAEVGSCRSEGRHRGAGQDAVRGEARTGPIRPRPRHGGCAAAATATATAETTAQTTTTATTTSRDLSPPAEAPPPRRRRPSGPVGTVGVRLAGLAALHRGERSAGGPVGRPDTRLRFWKFLAE